MEKYIISKKILSLDFIRFVATIQIVSFHYVCATNMPDAYVLLWGREGVALFFMISGAGLVNKYYKRGMSNKEIFLFYKSRFTSIYIPFWCCYLIVSIWDYYWNGFRYNPFDIPYKNILYSFFAFDGLAGVYGIPTFYKIGEWYLGIMLIVYLLFPLWLVFFKHNPLLVNIIFLILRIVISCNNYFEPLPVCFNPITAYSNFSLGAYSLYLVSDLSNQSLGNVFGKIRGVIYTLSAVIVISLGWYLGHIYNKQDFGEIFTSIGLWIILIIISKNIMKEDRSLIEFVCGISYEIFLVHHVVIYAMTPVVNSNFSVKNFLIGYLMAMAVILSTAYLLKKIIDLILIKKL